MTSRLVESIFGDLAYDAEADLWRGQEPLPAAGDLRYNKEKGIIERMSEEGLWLPRSFAALAEAPASEHPIAKEAGIDRPAAKESKSEKPATKESKSEKPTVTYEVYGDFSNCYYSAQALRRLRQAGAHVVHHDHPLRQKAAVLRSLAGRVPAHHTTFPVIFRRHGDRETFVGGNSDLRI